MQTKTKDLGYYMALDYPIVEFQEEGDPFFYASIPLLKGAMTNSPTKEGLPAMIRELKETWLMWALDKGKTIPEPE